MAERASNLSTLASNIKQGIDARLKDLHTSMPGIIETFDAEKQLATIQPAIRRIFVTRDGEKEILVPSDLPILINVPIIFPRGGGFSLTFPVKQGDECLLVFCERSIDNWHETGKVKVPGAKRFHSLSDATAFVGLSSIPNKVPNYDPDNTVIKKDDDSVYIKLNEDKSLEIFTESDIVAEAEGDVNLTVGGQLDAQITGNTNITSPNITLDGNVVITGNAEVQGDTSLGANVTSNSKDISDTHTHTGSPTAPGGPISDTGTPL